MIKKKCEKHGAFRKREVTKLINSDFSKPDKKRFISPKNI